MDVEDLDLLATELQSDRNVGLFDVNTDDVVNFADREYWVGELGSTFFGDANLDQEVSFADFLALSNGFGQSGGWAAGDFDGDGQTKFEDFLLLSDNFGKSAVAAAMTASVVPEPGAVLAKLANMLGVRRGPVPRKHRFVVRFSS